MLHTFRHSENFTVVLKKKQMRRGKVYTSGFNYVLVLYFFKNTWFWPWIMWLSGLSADLKTKGLQI